MLMIVGLGKWNTWKQASSKVRDTLLMSSAPLATSGEAKRTYHGCFLEEAGLQLRYGSPWKRVHI